MLSNVILISYLILTALIGAYLQKNNSISQFFVAKRGLGTLFVIPIVF